MWLILRVLKVAQVFAFESTGDPVHSRIGQAYEYGKESDNDLGEPRVVSQ